eukprot:gene26627-biopygen17029
MSRGCSRPESSWNRRTDPALRGIGNDGKKEQLRFQFDSGHEHPPRDMSSSETGHCY